MSTIGWTCPEWGRVIGRTGQGHDCAPGLSLDEYFETGLVTSGQCSTQ